MTRFGTILLAGGAVLALAGAAAADGGRHGGGMHGGGHGRGMHGGMSLNLLHAADANDDRSVTRAEVDALQSEMFAWLDRTGDGVLNADDRSPVEQRLAAKRAADAPDDGAEAGPDDRAEGRRHRRGGHDMVARLDADEDGSVTRDEFMSGGDKLFERFDANGDAVISPDEIDAKLEERSERRDERRFWWREN